VILYPKDPKAVVLAIAAWARSGGNEARSRLIDAVGRVLHAKRWLGLAGPQRQRSTGRIAATDFPEAAALALDVAKASITRAGKALSPLDAKTKTLLVVVDDDGIDAPGLELVHALESEVAHLRVHVLGPKAADDARAKAVALAADVDRVVVAVLCRVRAWKNRPGLAPEHKATLERIGAAGKPLTVVALCGPYALDRSVPSSAEVLLAWGDEPPCQRAAARALLGAEAEGRSPVPLTRLFTA
jgi:hypothetical protein